MRSEFNYSSELAVGAYQVGKTYRIYSSAWERFQGHFLEAVPKPSAILRSLAEKHAKSLGKEFQALHDITLEIRKGESVGIIGRNGSGGQALDPPAGGIREVAETIVEACLPALPELELDRLQDEPAPVGRPRYVLDTLEPLRCLDVEPVQLLARVRDDRALRRRPGSDPAVPAPRGEVDVGIFGREPLHRAPDPDLAFELWPEEDHGRCRVGIQL